MELSATSAAMPSLRDPESSNPPSTPCWAFTLGGWASGRLFIHIERLRRGSTHRSVFISCRSPLKTREIPRTILLSGSSPEWVMKISPFLLDR